MRLSSNNYAVVPLDHENLYSKQGGWSLDWYGLMDGAAGTCDCSGLFVPGRLHLLFNLHGQGVVLGERTRLGVSPSTISMCLPRYRVTATRLPGTGNHEFIILSLTAEWLKKTLGDRVESIYPVLWKSLTSDDASGKPVGQIRSMTLAEKDMAQQLSDPPVEKAAMPFWYSAKVVEILALHLFRPPGEAAEEPFCISQKRAGRERVDRVLEWLDQHLEQPLDLKSLAAHIGCAPHYLSRLFSKEAGRTISQQLRALRIEKASDLLNSGRFNVTEAAFEVGYNSLSHFTKAFVAEKGMKPSDFLAQQQ